jgi:hypothetical protein
MRSVVLPEGAAPAVQKTHAQILAVHAALLPTGKILFFSGDEHDPGRHHLGMFDHARLFDCQTLAITSPAPAPSIRDLFCCGQAFLPDGRLLVAGGTEAWTHAAITHDDHGHAAMGHFRGIADAYVFDPASESWSAVARMVFQPWTMTGGGRWYPTLVTLGTGRVAAMSGHPSDSDTRHFNNTIETFTATPAPQGHWIDRGTVPAEMTFYPRCYVVKDGTLFFASPIAGQSRKWNETSAAWTVVAPGPPVEYAGFDTSSVLLPLLPEFNFRTRVLMCGRQVPVYIDLDDVPPSWKQAGTRTLLFNGAPPVRTHCNAVLLPTGDVVVCGGLRDPGDDPAAAVREIEIYHPFTNTWTTRPAPATAQVCRNYHSVAVLMPDGRVWMAGSNFKVKWSYHNPADYPAALPQDAQQGSVDNRELRIELYEPWYFGRPDRPTIANAPATAVIGSAIQVQTPQAASISRVVLLRLGSCTHSFNSDQRYVGAAFTRGAGVLNVTLPNNPHVLPPGPYLLFVLQPGQNAGVPAEVPSIGRHIRVDLAVPATPPSLTVQLNATAFTPGQTLVVTATSAPGSPPEPVDAYIVIKLPNGQFLSAQLGGGFVPGILPIATNIVPPALTQQVAQYAFNGSEPVGTYTWFAVFTTPGTQNFVSALDQDTFVFTT